MRVPEPAECAHVAVYQWPTFIGMTWTSADSEAKSAAAVILAQWVILATVISPDSLSLVYLPLLNIGRREVSLPVAVAANTAGVTFHSRSAAMPRRLRPRPSAFCETVRLYLWRKGRRWVLSVCCCQWCGPKPRGAQRSLR